jgi:hypothetical protein
MWPPKKQRGLQDVKRHPEVFAVDAVIPDVNKVESDDQRVETSQETTDPMKEQLHIIDESNLRYYVLLIDSDCCWHF